VSGGLFLVEAENGAYALPKLFVGDADDDYLGYVGQSQDLSLDVEGGELVAAGLDDVLRGASYDVVVLAFAAGNYREMPVRNTAMNVGLRMENGNVLSPVL
jgi:hypothetical protein